MRVSAFAWFALLCLATPGQANWQYTKWGMTIDALKKAGGASIMDYSDANLDTSKDHLGAITNYDAMGYSFVAMFYFSRQTNGLSKVSLMLKKPASCSELEPDLRNIYGEPSAMLPLGVRQWRDEQNGNIVSLVPLAGCFVEYGEILKKSGL